MRPEIATGDIVAARFVLQRVVGQGGMGVVWQARDLATQAVVALKFLLSPGADATQRFRREVEALRSLRHPAIVRHVADGSHAGTPWLAMEWLEGKTLEQVLAAGPLAPAAALRCCARVADALAAAHAIGWVHRDLKPANVMLLAPPADEIRLLDFGIVTAGVDPVAAPLTHAGTLLGTPGYMSPEQAGGEGPVDARADVFSLGCLVYECLVGRPVFVGGHVLALLARVLFEPAPRLGASLEVAPALDALVDAMLSKHPAARPASMAEIAAALRAVDAKLVRPRAEPAPKLMEAELRWACALMVGRATNAGTEETLDATRARLGASAIERIATAFGASAAAIRGAQVLLWQDELPPTDAAIRAARAALALRAALPETPMALAGGRSGQHGGVPVGDALERAAACLEGAPAGSIVVDDRLARLLEGRFDLLRDPARIQLLGPRSTAAPSAPQAQPDSLCLGRDVEITTFSATFNECLDLRVPGVALITGEVGLGKSRLLRAFAAAAHAVEPEARVWCLGSEVAEPLPSFGGLAGMLRSACGASISEDHGTLCDRLRDLVADCVPAPSQSRVWAQLCEIVGASPPTTATPSSPSWRDPVARGDQRRMALIELLSGATAHAPLIILVDDLQWMDYTTIEFLGHALRCIGDRPWMVVAAGRETHRERFPELWRDLSPRVTELAPLRDAVAKRLLQRALGTGLPGARHERLLQLASGNPLFLEELARAEGGGQGDDVPETVLGFLDARLGRLPAPVRRVLRAASVLGGSFEQAAVDAVLGEAAEPQLLPQLAREGWLRSEGPRWSFRQVAVREAAYAQLLATDRQRGHFRAAEWLRARAGTAPALIAAHLDRSEAPAEAAPWWVGAGEQALSGNDFAGAQAAAARALRLPLPGDLRARARLVCAECCAWQGDPSGRFGFVCAIVEDAEAPDDFRALALGIAANAAWQLGRADEVVRFAQMVLALVESGIRNGEQFLAATRACGSLLQASRVDEAQALFARCEAWGRARPSAGADARLAHLRAIRAGRLDEPAVAVREMLAAADHFSAANDPRLHCLCRGNAGLGLIELGRHVEAVASLESVFAEATRLGVKAVAAHAQQNLCLAHARCGNYDLAMRHGLEALRSSEGTADWMSEMQARIELARVHLLRDHLEAAIEEAQRAYAISDEPGEVRALAALTLADGLRRRARPDDLRQALALLGGDTLELARVEAPSFTRRVHVDVLFAAGQHAEAERERAAARAWLATRAARITDGAQRETYLRGEPDNAALLEGSGA